MPIVVSDSTLLAENSVVTLALYQKVINYPECAFFGVNMSGETTRGRCRIVLKSDRDQIQDALAEAQQEIEQVTGFPLQPKWFASEQHQYGPIAPGLRFRKWQVAPVVMTKKSKVIEIGVEAETTISAGEVVDHTNDPAVIGPVATAVTDEDEIHIFHPGTDIEIDPSSVTISGGNVTIEAPRCRMVLASLADNPSQGLDYTDLSNFESTVDVKRVYNDSSQEVTVVHPKRCNCTEDTQSGCIYVDDYEIGILEVSRNNGTSCNCNCIPEFVRINYRAGLNNVGDQVEQQVRDMVIRLAHSKMPYEPCGCDLGANMWRRDRNIPATLTRERVNCPFGLSDGAWFAWQQANAIKVWRASAI
jgi:hypothetical protein